MLLALTACQSAPPTTNVSQAPRTLPPNTVLLSTMMGDLSAQPGFDARILQALAGASKTGAAVLSPKLLRAFRQRVLGRNWQALDMFPGWPMGDINPVVTVAGDLDPLAVGQEKPVAAYIDLGSYALDQPQTIDLDRPSTLPGFSSEGLVTPLGEDVVRGDGPNPAIAPMHSESQRLADAMNRLAFNRLEGTAPARATLAGRVAQTPEDLLRVLLASGHEVTVADARYFANFGHLHYEGMDVMMPFWVDTGVRVPGTSRDLKVPVAHAEYEWFVRGPKINADVAFYFGIDGKADFRVMDTLDQAWVMGRHAHEYRGQDAVEVTRLTGLLALAYAHAHLAHPRLAFGGYYPLGVCQDGVAAIELKMTGTSTLFPNTADMSLFQDSRDAEINALLAAIPKDRDGHPPNPERVFGSLPTDRFDAVSIPGLAPDLASTYRAWEDGSLAHPHRFAERVAGFIAMGLLCVLVLWQRKRRRTLHTPPVRSLNS